MLPNLSPWSLVHVAAIGIGLLLYVKRTRSSGRYRSPSAAFAWVIALIAVPYIALPAFYVFARRKLQEIPIIHWPASTRATTAHDWFDRAAVSLALPPARLAPSPLILTDGPKAFDALVDLINTAQYTVDFETFIFSDDQSGAKMIQALIDAYGRGVRVRALLDELGNRPHMVKVRQILRDGGVDIRRFGRVTGFRSLATGNLRNHRKQVIVDGESVWCGGRNIADEYFFEPDQKGWTDLSYVLHGDVAADAQTLFNEDWNDQFAITQSHRTSFSEGVATVRLIPSGPDFAGDPMHELLLEFIGKAATGIRIATPYFVPDDELLNALLRALRRGVRVELLTPAKSNHSLADFVRKRSLRHLAYGGGQIALLPRMSHAKLVIIDDVAFCGSHNFDTRSLFLNYELSVCFTDVSSVSQFEQWFAAQWETSQLYVADSPSLLLDLAEGATRTIAYQL